MDKAPIQTMDTTDVGNLNSSSGEYDENNSGESKTSDGMDDEDFSSEDEEFFEGRKKIRDERVLETEARIAGWLPSQPQVTYSCPSDEDVEGYQSEYENSDSSYASLESDEDADFILRDKNRNAKVYAKNCDHKALNFEVGMRFRDCRECKEAVRLWAILNGHNVRWKKSGGSRLEAVCEKGCPWYFSARKLNTDPTCVIKSYIDAHKCVRPVHNRQATCDWLASVILPALKRNPRYSPDDIIHDVGLIYDTKVAVSMCHRARKKALEKLGGSYETHYNMLRSYVSELMKRDKGGKFELKTYLDREDKCVFQRIYIGFSALVQGFWVGCRRCIGFDACFLKTVLGGALLAGVAKDCNNKMYPIAWAVVEKENEETWTWFFERLFEQLNIIDGNGWTFMSDKQKGLINGIHKLAPNAEHRHCARHVYANWKKTFSGPKYKALFWDAVKCTTDSQFRLKMEEIKQESLAAYEGFFAKRPQTFCKSLISLHTRTDIVDNNICETFNSYILHFRDKPIIDMLEEIRHHLMTRMHRISESLQSSTDILCPNIRKKIEKIQSLVKYCRLRPASVRMYEVIMNNNSYIVDLIKRECSCRWWMLTGIPCCHAIACVFHIRDDVARYVDAFYYRSNCIEAYKNALPPILGPNDWPQVHEALIFPPKYMKLPGRPKKNRRRDPTEEVKARQNKMLKIKGQANEEGQLSVGRLSKVGVQMRCRTCKKFGHNKRTCKEEVQSSQPKSKGKRVPAKESSRQSRKKAPTQQATEAAELRDRSHVDVGCSAPTS